MKKVPITTITALMEIMANKCVNCRYTNVCIQLMREKCVGEVLIEQKIVVSK